MEPNHVKLNKKNKGIKECKFGLLTALPLHIIYISKKSIREKIQQDNDFHNNFSLYFFCLFFLF